MPFDLRGYEPERGDFPIPRFQELFVPRYGMVCGAYIRSIYCSAMQVIRVSPKHATFLVIQLCVHCLPPKSDKQNRLRGLIISHLVRKGLLPLAKLYINPSNHIVYCKAEFAAEVVAAMKAGAASGMVGNGIPTAPKIGIPNAHTQAIPRAPDVSNTQGGCGCVAPNAEHHIRKGN